MIPRYQSPAMRALWSDETKYKTWFKVEKEFLSAYLGFHGREDESLLGRLSKWQASVDWTFFKEKVQVHEQRTKHDVIAFLCAVEDEVGEDARLLHLGLTSSDIVDTTFALLLKEASENIEQSLTHLIRALWDKANLMRGVLTLGRTHGQAAEPITFGIKLLSHLAELVRGAERLKNARAEISVGKFSGALGTYAYVHPDIEKAALHALGLTNETVATQVVARDRHAVFFTTLAVLGGTLDRLAVELRLLSHGGIKEISEPFSVGQKGSSAMPHKKNPILSENVSGLIRLLRSYALAALEDQALWHERDISHSSVERVIAPDATSILDFALSRLQGVIEGLVVDEERIAAHVREAGDGLYSQGVMLALVQKGMQRGAAHELVQKAAHGEDESLGENLRKLGIDEWLKEDELAHALSSKAHVAQENVLFERVHKEASPWL